MNKQDRLFSLINNKYNNIFSIGKYKRMYAVVNYHNMMFGVHRLLKNHFIVNSKIIEGEENALKELDRLIKLFS